MRRDPRPFAVPAAGRRGLHALALATLTAATASAWQAEPSPDEQPPVAATAAPDPTDRAPVAASPAPIAAPSTTPPPAASTTVAPVRPRRVTLGERGAIELGRPRAASGRWKGFPISLSLRDAPLPEVLRSLSRLVGVNLVLDPRVQGEVTVELVDVPWDQALHVILRSHGMAAELDGRVWVVHPR